MDLKNETYEDVTKYMMDRVGKSLDSYPYAKQDEDYTWEILWGDSPLGWDVYIYFKNTELRKDIHKMMMIGERIADAIGVELRGSDCEWENAFEIDKEWTRLFFCADIIPFKDFSNKFAMMVSSNEMKKK